MKHLRSMGSMMLKRCFTTNHCLTKNAHRSYSNLTKFTKTLSVLRNSTLKRFAHGCDEFVEDWNELTEHEHEEMFVQPVPVKYILSSNSTDHLITKLNNCISVQEVLSLVDDHEKVLKSAHIAQAVLVLWDLQKMFYHISFTNNISNASVTMFDALNRDYVNRLNENESFRKILNLIEQKLDEFNLDQISCIVLYLNKMGISIKDRPLQLLVEQFKNKLKTDEYSLAALSRFVVAVCSVRDLSYIYTLQDIIPLIYKQIDNSSTSEELKLTTICLNHINRLVTDDILTKYKEKINKLLANGVVSGNDYKTILKIILFLNYPNWRDKNVTVVSSCINLLKNTLHLLNASELILLHEILYKNQEPGDVLNDIQRCSSKYLQQLEEEASPMMEIRLKLFTTVVYFAPPSQRPHFEKVIKRYVELDLDGSSLLELYKVLFFNKITDTSICRTFWSKTLTSLKDKSFRDANLLKICHNYAQFNRDINQYRHNRLEKELLNWLEHEINHGISWFIPYKFSMIASFLLIYASSSLLNRAIGKIHEMVDVLNHISCLNISHSLQFATKLNKSLSYKNIEDIKLCLSKCTYRILENNTSNISKTNLLLKGYIFRGDENPKLFEELINDYSSHEGLTSKSLTNIALCLYSSDTLLPDIINRMVDYIIEHKQNVLGFNIERIVYLCYYFGYLPRNSEKFFDVVIDVILRDQERLSGLSHIQACLSLCYFSALPLSFIQQIFNVEFLDKLDIELANCYFKETYPMRVRERMMQLNRAVCLDYPAANVPWFHEKYVQDIKKKVLKDSERENNFTSTIREYLSNITGGVDVVKQNEVSPYGYHIDFVIYGSKTEAENKCSKVAVLLATANKYTNLNVQLKGEYQMKVRHLEMLGYRVVVVNYLDWNKILSGEEKKNHLKELICPVIPYSSIIVNR